MKAKDWFLDLARGSALGLGMVPGVSAGTVGIVVNVYDKLINGLSNLRKNFWESVKTLLPIGIGAVIASVIVLLIIHKTFDLAPVAIISLFAGLTAGSIPFLCKNLEGSKIDAKQIGLMILGFVIAASIGISSALSKIYWNLDLESYFISAPWWIYLLTVIAGFVAAVACIIPGISGAMILFIFGLYNPILDMYSLSNENSVFNNHSRIGSVIGLTLCLGVGMVLGLVMAAKGMKTLLEKQKVKTFDLVIGFVAGSVVSMFCNQQMVLSDNTWVYKLDYTKPYMYVISAALFLIGIICCYFATKKLKRA